MIATSDTLITMTFRIPAGLGLLAAAALLAACSSTAPDDASSSPTTAPYPISADGSIITPSGYVFQGDFAICNQAKCGEPGPDGNAQCECQMLQDTWTLSPVPTSSFVILNQSNLVMSTFTTTNVTSARSVKCNGGQWADCYGALCTQNADGTATCTCPVSAQNPGEWMKYVDDCSDPDAGCGADLVSVAPLFPQGNPSYTDFVAAVKQAGDSVPAIPQGCPDSESGASTNAGGAVDCQEESVAASAW